MCIIPEKMHFWFYPPFVARVAVWCVFLISSRHNRTSKNINGKTSGFLCESLRNQRAKGLFLISHFCTDVQWSKHAEIHRRRRTETLFQPPPETKCNTDTCRKLKDALVCPIVSSSSSVNIFIYCWLYCRLSVKVWHAFMPIILLHT